ncbi:MAG: site-specific integrase [Ruminococcus sp.]|nr:site-specific integrase [Ruminococcus sp.]
MPKKKANGEHSIYFDEKRKTYVGQITLGYDENGKRKRKTVYGKTKHEVREKIKQIEYGIASGTFVDKSDITIYHLAKQMLDDNLNMGYIKESTYHRTYETLKRLKPIYNTPLQSAIETQIKDFLLKEQSYAQSTIKKDFQLLKRTFEEAVDRHIIASNPMAKMKMPKSKKPQEKVRALTLEEEKRLFEVLQNEDINYSQQMLLSMLTGMRMGEINALDVTDVNFLFNIISIKRTMSRGAKGEAIISKTAKTAAGERKIPLTDDTRQILRDCIKDHKSGLIFTHNGKMITTNQVNSQYSRVLKKYNILDEAIDGRVDLHSLRHTYATRCIEAGMQPKVLQLLLGHTDITITMNTYCDAFDSFRDDNISMATEYMKKAGLTLHNFADEKTALSNVKYG